MEKQMTCHWKYCRKQVMVDDSIEDSISWVNVVGWCDFHQKVFGKQHDMMCKSGKDMSNYLWQNDRKKYLTIQKKAIEYVKKHN